MGFLLDDAFGFVFSFGVYVCNTFIPESTTYLNEIIQQLVFVYPVFFLLLHRLRGVRGSTRCCGQRRACELICMGGLSLLQSAFSVLNVLVSYGAVAFCLSPGRLWLIALAWCAFLYAGCLAERERGGKFEGSHATGSTLFVDFPDE